ncbi:DUF4625 domain-containing protein [Flammeovirga agarivorans]|uniref:DUF4625 domain-containing protein n=1 Tax=Flammeovirga agarivorans TaxID=2726742 RepID=A0A7X8SH46_9BACT|nr:DUF4625 domain-containing protein [Flammeovirga agarivorans]NLR90100.1 DUF4625 domain-containing protein [Flammeovirga agarivorans]
MKNNFHYIILLPLIILFSCNNKEDLSPKPQITNFKVSDGHHHHNLHEGSVIFKGEEAIIDADLEGNQLSTVKLDIHWGEGHEHNVTHEGDSILWATNIIWQFGINDGLTPEGVYPNNHKLHEHIDIPRAVDGLPIKEGNYHFVLHLWDHEGNETQSVLNVEITSKSEEG